MGVSAAPPGSCRVCARPLGTRLTAHVQEFAEAGTRLGTTLNWGRRGQLAAGVLGGVLGALSLQHCVLCTNGPHGQGKPLLYWSESPGGSPDEYLGGEEEKRIWIAAALAQGTRGIGYMGYANCRICDTLLGSADMTGWGFVWPEKAEHYLLAHSVWTPQCMDFFNALPKDLKL